MGVVLNLKKEKEEELQLITGGKGGGDATCWLQNMEVGEIFYVQDKNNPLEFALGLFRLEEKVEDKVYHLRTPNMQQTVPVNPTRFCNKFILYHSLGVIKEQELKDDDHRDEGNSGVSADDLEGHDRREG